jgi:cation diffusion facilitator family transporter
LEKSEDFSNIRLTLGLYIVIFAMKLTVYFMSGVMALLAEALHTFADIIVTGFLLLAAWYSRRKADAVHMYGHGRAQNVAALVAATLFVSFTSFELYKEAIPRLFQTEERAYQNLSLVIGVLVLSIIIAATPLVKLIKQKGRGAAAKAQMMELINDELGLLAALLGTLFIIWGQTIADPIAAIVVATIIVINAAGLFRENFSVLVGRSPGDDYLRKVKQLALSVPGVLGVHEVRAEYIGSETVHAEMHIEVQRGLSVGEGNRIADEVQRHIYTQAEGAYCMIHVDEYRGRNRAPDTDLPD